MKIAAVIPKLISFDMDGSLTNPRFTWRQKHIVLVFVVTESGVVGVGEAWASGAAPGALMATIEDDLAPLMVGQDALAPARHWAALNEAALVSARRGIFKTGQAAIDIALWDLMGKAANLPVFRLLGGFSDSATVYASAGLYGRDKGLAELAEEMTGYISQGFNAVKMKVGGAPHAEDVERVRAVREAIGPNVRLMIDGVYAMDPPSALRLSKAIESYDVYWFEQPVHPDDLDGMAQVNLRGNIPVAGNENASEQSHFVALMEKRAVHFVQADTLVIGGISDGRNLAALAASRHLPMTLHHASSIVGMAASLHLAAGVANIESVEYHMVHQWLFDRVPADLFPMHESKITLSERPGLGLDLSPDDF